MDDILAGFQTINVAKGPVTMTIASSGVSFSKAAVQTLGNPEFVRLLVNEDAKKVAIQVANKDDSDAVSFFKPTRKTGDVRWNYGSLKNSLADLMDWDLAQHTYRADGHYYRGERVLMFDLAVANQLK